VQHADVLVTTSFDDARTIDQATARLRDRMHLVDDLCQATGRDPATLGRLYSAGYGEEGIFTSVDSMSDWVGHLVEAGATELAFYLHDPAMGAYDRLVESGQFASRDALTELAQDVMPQYQIRGTPV
jgi:hypothetical protein